MKKILARVSIIAAIAVGLTGCGSKNAETSTTADKKFDKKYIIATDATYAPFSFEKGGKYTGIDVDILDAVSKVEDFEYELKPMDFNGIIPAIQSNQIDGAIAGMGITEERKKVLDMSAGYYEAGIAAVVKEDNDEIKSEEDFKGKIFAVKKGTSGAKYAETNKGKLGVTIKYFNDTPSMMQEVKNGNADVTFEDYPVVAYMVYVNPDSGVKIAGEKLTKQDFGFAVKKGSNKELLDAFNDGLKKIKANGEYDKIISKYIKK